MENIIFDLGGVLIDIDYTKTNEAFKRIGCPNFDDLLSQPKTKPLFEALETGKISENDFLETIIRKSNLHITKRAFITAWNAMLLSFNAEYLIFLEIMAVKYNIYLLSNTNSIHFKRFQEIFTRDTGKPSFDIYFSKAWYSHLLGLRKPQKEIYEFVLHEVNLEPSTTLFIDDSIKNISGAKEVGLNTHLLLPTEKIEQLGL